MEKHVCDNGYYGLMVIFMVILMVVLMVNHGLMVINGVFVVGSLCLIVVNHHQSMVN